MQINMSGLNAGIYTTNAILKNRGGSNTAKQGNQSAFGAQCKVTISKEGRVLTGTDMNAMNPAYRVLTGMMSCSMWLTEAVSTMASRT